MVGKSCRLLTLLLLLPVGSVLGQQMAPWVQDYCLNCHNTEDWAGSLAFDTLDYDRVATDAESWEKVVRKLRAGMMPPPGEPRPTRSQATTFAQALESKLDNASAAVSQPPLMHRLNRNEYANVIRDLLALDLDISALLPQDNASEGFDNIASSLGVSPALVQGYISAAMKISRSAVGDINTPEQIIIYDNSTNLRQDRHLDGTPLGTRGGLRVIHNFPVDAEYEFLMRGRLGGFTLPGLGFDSNSARPRAYITFDGIRIHPDSTQRFRMSVPAGKHELTISILDYQRPAGVNDIYSHYSAVGEIGGVEIHGPFAATSTGNTASRRAIFTCYPSSQDDEVTCAREILSGLATRAFREPLREQDLAPLLEFYDRGYAEGGFEVGIQQGLSRILMDPRFLFRFEQEPAAVKAGETYAISDMELASRLSFFLWSSIPDTELLDLANRNSLHDPTVLTREVQRMLQDPRAEALVKNFAGQWLQLRQLQTLTPETEAFNENLRLAFIRETSMLFAHIIAADRPVTDILDASYTFLNERLAQHYGIDGVHGDYFRRVDLAADSLRRGIFGKASFLTVTSTASRTSPVIRGDWVLANLLHAPMPAPPEGVETNIDGDGSVKLTTSVRNRLEAHRQDPSCNACHGVIDPVGFALENFDLIGAWRASDGDSAVDAKGTLVDGTAVNGAADLRVALMAHKELYITAFTEKLLTYALGRKLEYYDMPAVRAIVREASQRDYRFSAIVNALVTNPVFLTRVGSTKDLAVTPFLTESVAESAIENANGRVPN